MDSMFEHIVDNKINQVYFHNLSFDGDFIMQYLIKNDYVYVDSPMYDRATLSNGEWTWMCDSGGSIYSIEVLIGGHKFEFRCSYKVLNAPISRLGKMISSEYGIEFAKEEIDYDEYYHFDDKKEVPEELLSYLKKDIDIALYSMLLLSDNYEVKATAASTSKNAFIDYYGKEEFVKDFGGSLFNIQTRESEVHNVLTHKQFDHISKSYSGGRVFIRPGGQDVLYENINGVSTDLVSSYPGIMKELKMPYGSPLHSPPVGFDFIELVTVKIYSATKNDPEMPSFLKDKTKSSRFDTHYTDTVYDTTYVMWREELEFLEKHYTVKYDIYHSESLFFRVKKTFEEYINHIKKLKMSSEGALRDIYKLIINAFYGKFGEKPEKGRYAIEEYEEDTVYG